MIPFPDFAILYTVVGILVAVIVRITDKNNEPVPIGLWLLAILIWPVFAVYGIGVFLEKVKI